MLLLSRRCWTCCWSSQSWAMAAELPAGRTRPRRPAWCCPSFPPSSSDLRGLPSLLKAFQLSSCAEDEVVAVRMEFGGPGLSPTGAGGVCGHRTATAHPAAPDPSRWAQGGQGQLLPLTLCPTRAQQQVSGWKGPAALQRSRSSSTRTSERWGRCSGSGAQRSALQGGGCSARSRDPAPTLSQPPEADPHGTVPGGLRWQRPPAAAEGACRALPATSSESQLTGELHAWQPKGDVLVLPPSRAEVSAALSSRYSSPVLLWARLPWRARRGSCRNRSASVPAAAPLCPASPPPFPPPLTPPPKQCCCSLAPWTGQAASCLLACPSVFAASPHFPGGAVLSKGWNGARWSLPSRGRGKNWVSLRRIPASGRQHPWLPALCCLASVPLPLLAATGSASLPLHDPVPPSAPAPSAGSAAFLLSTAKPREFKHSPASSRTSGPPCPRCSRALGLCLCPCERLRP